jgi:peptidoglycan/xylan/chitin deacetylase (PgdA/CDA1 family)
VLDIFSAQLFFGPAQRRLFQRALPIFKYHSIAAPPAAARDPFLFVTPDRFAAQLQTLKQNGYSAASLDDLSTATAKDAKRVVLTFDDGYRNVLRNGLPVLQQQGFRAIEYIVADLIGQRNEWDVVHGDAPEPLMDVSEIRDWLAAGQEIGSHSLTHRNLVKLSTDDAREQIFASKKRLEDTFGIPIRHFCYPHGKWNAQVRDLVREAGYATACTTEFGVNDAATPPFELRRIFCLSESEMLRKAAHRLRRKLRGS